MYKLKMDTIAMVSAKDAPGEALLSNVIDVAWDEVVNPLF